MPRDPTRCLLEWSEFCFSSGVSVPHFMDVHCWRYWVDEPTSKIFCVVAPVAEIYHVREAA